MQLRPQLGDAVGQRALDGERQVRQPEVEQRFVAEFRPNPSQQRGARQSGMQLVRLIGYSGGLRSGYVTRSHQDSSLSWPQ